MQKKEVLTDVGVIIGRFQIDELHHNHKEIIEFVIQKHDRVILLLGVAKGNHRDNMLDYEMRSEMIKEQYPDIIISYVEDKKLDDIWSKNVDSVILTLKSPMQTVTLYGGRDSFIKHYSGKFKTQELEPTSYVNTSATSIRKKISNKPINSADFRRGIIFNAINKYPQVFPTVDIAIFNEHYTKILLARKPDEKEWRFVGGFADPTSDSYEIDAKREVAEETHLEVDNIKYLGSSIVNDWRYTGKDKIKTMLFSAKVIFGSPLPDDDIEEVRWFDLCELKLNYKKNMVDTHIILFEKFILNNKLFSKN